MPRCWWVLAVLFATRAVADPIDRKTLPEWQAPAGDAKAPEVEIYAADADGDRLLSSVADREPLLAPVTNKRLTGHVVAKGRGPAIRAVAAQLGVDLAAMPKLRKGVGAMVDVEFGNLPGADLIEFLGIFAHVNIVAGAALPSVILVAKHVPWDSVLAAYLTVAGLQLVASGSTRYLLPAGAKLEPLPRKPGATVSLDVKDATIGEALAALREVTDVPAGACGGKRFTLRLRDVSFAEASRALALLSGEQLVPGTTCPASKLAAGGPVDDLRLTAIATRGTKRAAAFDHRGAIVTATVPAVKEIGATYVTLSEDHTLQLKPNGGTPPFADGDEFLAGAQRVTALVRVGATWTAYIETRSGGLMVLDGSHADELAALGARIDADGVHVKRPSDSAELTIPLARR